MYMCYNSDMAIFLMLLCLFILSWFLVFLLFKESNKNSDKFDRILKEMQKEQLKFEEELYMLRNKKNEN